MRSNKIWAILLHLGCNMWRKDDPVTGANKDEEESIYRDFLYTDKETWQKVIDFLPSCGINTVLIDMGEGVQYDSHPELAVKGSWPKAEFRQELDRIRSLGLTPLPKFNFSAGHNAFLQEHAYTVGTDHYNQVCKDLIEEVIDLFDTPEFFHLGMEEEDMASQKNQPVAMIRPPYTKTADSLFLFDVCRSHGVRPWIWVDPHTIESYGGEEAFRDNIPKDVLLSNWYYGIIKNSADVCQTNPNAALHQKIGQWGFEQVPTVSTWSWYLNDKQTMRFCADHVEPESLRGFMTAPWLFSVPNNYYGLLNDAFVFGNAKQDIFGEG